MNSRRKYNGLRVMMILSLTVLTGFAVYWLRNQYLEEKAGLKDVLLYEYKLARDEVLDSMLFSHYIRPILGDSVTVSLEMKKDSVKEDIFFTHSTASAIKVEKLDSGLFVLDSIHNKADFQIIQQIDVDSFPPSGRLSWNDSTMLIRSFKMILSRNDSGPEKNRLTLISLPDEQMESLLEENYRLNLDDRGLKFAMSWRTDTSANGKILKKVINIGDDSPHFHENIYVAGTNAYLLKKILPQILFVIFLVGLTSAAFFLTFRAMKNQYELNIIRKDFISNMTHELKTPVATMKVALEALHLYYSSEDTIKATEYMEIASKEVNRLDHLIERMLDHIILEENDSSLKTEKVDLDRLVSESILMLRTRIEEMDAIVEFTEGNSKNIIMADPWYIQSVIINLIDNSLKYSGAKPEIKIRIMHEDGMIRLKIEDNGPGIPSEYSEKIFDRFFRVPTGNLHPVKGHGLGLSLAQLVMKMHRGKIYQQNLSEGGCSFVLEFLKPDNEDKDTIR